MIKKFYNAQKAQGLLFAFIGFLSLLSSFLILNMNNSEFAMGLIIPLIIVGMIQVYMGIDGIIKSPKHFLVVQNFVKNNQEAIVSIEIPTIQAKLKLNKLLINILLVLIAFSVLFIFVFNNNPMLFGVGIGLFFQSLISIAAYYFANQRSQIYIKWLHDYYN